MLVFDVWAMSGGLVMAQVFPVAGECSVVGAAKLVTTMRQ